MRQDRGKLRGAKGGSGRCWRGWALALGLALSGLSAGCEEMEGPAPASPKVENIYGAAMDGDLSRVQYYLQEDPAAVNARNESGLTPLHLAAWKGHSEVVRYLLRERADPNLQDINGDTPLHFAASWGYRDIVQLLLAQGAKVNARNRDGKTPLSRVRPKPEIAKILRQHGGVE